MKFHPIPLFTALLLLTISTAAQDDRKFDLLLKNGPVTTHKNINPEALTELQRNAKPIAGKSYLVLQFERIPSDAERKELLLAGIELLEYVPNNAYTATVTGSLNLPALTKFRVRSVVALTPEQKMQPDLANGVYPPSAVRLVGTIDVLISFPKSFSLAVVKTAMQEKNFDLISTELSSYRIIGLRISTQRLAELASMSCVEYVQALPPDEKMLNHNSAAGSRANILTMPGGRDLRGQGIVMGVGDNTDPQLHIDFTNRLITRAPLPYVNGGSNHGTHVAGTAGGAGNGTELYRGYASKARLITQAGSGILINAPAYVKDDSMVVTNNSYGVDEDGCNHNGLYDLYSRFVDQQAFDLPRLQHVFAAGNSGGITCPTYPAGFHTVLGSYQSSKNVIVVGNTLNTGVIAGSSSRGPVNDGRIKPEITAMGFAVASSVGPSQNAYGVAFGTSMSSPAVSGGAAMLIQRYKQLNGNVNPKNGLIKALICNGGRDMGNAGPDYRYGFGWMNLVRSVEMMENNRYVISSVANAVNNTHNITVPANTAELKVMLYWNDPPASLLSSQALVNDVDLEVRNPSSVLTLPLILDTTRANVNNVAVNGVDHINNIEQVVITNPTAGAYTITVKGTAITQNPNQEYYLVYDFVPVETKITHPAGGEKFFRGEGFFIQWDSYGDPANTFTVSFTTDNWATSFDTVVAADVRHLLRFLPAGVSTDQAYARITRNGTGMISTSQAFTVIDLPAVTLSSVQCEGYISLQWPAVAGATDYEVMMLQGDEMVSKGITVGTSFTISGLSKDSLYWVSVRARVNGNPGRRSDAISRQPNSGACTGTISDNDLKIDALVAPKSGRVLTSSSLTAATVISVRVKNLDDNTVNNFNVKYSVNGGAFISEGATNIAGGATYTHNFAATQNFATPNDYVLRVVVENTSATDPVGNNDTLTVTIRQLPNAPITLITGTDLVDDIEGAADSTYYNGQIGLVGADRYDFNSSTALGRVRTFINSGIAHSGDKAFTLDASRFNAGGTADSLKATYNLLPHFATPDDIRFDFYYKQHEQAPDNANRIWVRGDDTKAWISVYDLYDNQAEKGEFKKSTSIELSDILAANGQDFSTSFQVRFGQYGNNLTADNEGGAGYTFDDIRIYKVDNDIQMVSLDTPIVASCGLGSSVPIRVTVRNSADTTVTNIPVRFSVDGGTAQTGTIASIPGNTSISFTFTPTADLSALGEHVIKVWVAYIDDSFRDNDTITVTIINSEVITAFPHVQNFEANDGGWFTNGLNNSWEYGTPASTRINRAASGAKAWKTNLTGFYKDRQLSYLYSPCYDIASMTTPTLSLSIALDLEDCGSGAGDLCDGAYVEYSADGINWTRLGAQGQGTNWYNKNYPGNHLWSVENYTRWHVATIPLPTGLTKLRLRFVITTDPFVNRDGIAIDDIHIYDNVYGIYDGPPYTSNTVTQAAVSGSNWIDFVDGGKLIASVNPNGQNLGTTNARTYIHTGAVRNSSGQYYHNRNITVKPANVHLADSATVRFYFLDTETEALINATGCSGCSKPTTAFALGVSKYSDVDTSKENGTIADNATMDWLFITPTNVAKVPFDRGYYAEFKVKDFSEFWLNNGGLSTNQVLPVSLLSFTARKQSNKDVLAEWTTASEINTNRFEVEVAKGNRAFQLNQFVKIGEVSSVGNSNANQHYAFNDIENNKTGVRYYRLKMVDNDGRFTYSPVRPVVFDEEVKWQVYPNPSQGVFNLVYQVNVGDNVSLKLFDINGKVVKQVSIPANGFVQKHIIDIHSPQFAPGMYLLEAAQGENKQVFRLVKQ
ncbi:MAG: S8 family serine peptidase [Chitinophagaceae bacterium]|nr:S8 family serine peptidase [Chitinophagaceae bacterium]